MFKIFRCLLAAGFLLAFSQQVSAAGIETTTAWGGCNVSWEVNNYDTPWVFGHSCNENFYTNDPWSFDMDVVTNGYALNTPEGLRMDISGSYSGLTDDGLTFDASLQLSGDLESVGNETRIRSFGALNGVFQVAQFNLMEETTFAIDIEWSNLHAAGAVIAAESEIYFGLDQGDALNFHRLVNTSGQADPASGSAAFLITLGEGQHTLLTRVDTTLNTTYKGGIIDQGADLHVSMSVVPVPAAVWLFGSALGALGWARRRPIPNLNSLQ